MTTIASDRPKFFEKISYGFGDLASVLYWQTFMLYLTYFYTDVAILPLGFAAGMIFWVRTWDWINDPIMGVIADRTQTRWGKFRPWLLWTCVPFAVAGVMCFTVPDFSESGRLLWAVVTYTLLMTLYTVINIPYTSLLGVISPESRDRTTISSIKFLFAFGAGIIVSASLLPMAQGIGGGDEAAQLAKGFQATFIIYGIAAVGFFLIAFFFTKERVQPPKGQKTPIKEDFRDLVANKPWLILTAMTLTFILFVGVRGSVTIHYLKYFVVEQEVWLPFVGSKTYGFVGLSSIFNTIGQASSFAGVLLIPLVAKLVGKKRAFIILFSIAIISTAACFLLKPEQIYLLLLLQIIGSMTGGPMSVLLWAMYADTADFGEWKNGRRATGLIFSASTASQKVGWALSASFAILLMNSVGFVANESQSPESLRGLVLLFSLIPAALGLVSIIIAFFYPLTDQSVADLEQELAERKLAAPPSPPTGVD
jgi:glycoside/pentoside/hexuronide:cation symporter, GPH family